MTSPELMQDQIQLWMRSQHEKIGSSGVDTLLLKKEIAKLKDQEDRYNKAYGSGIFTIEQLKEYTAPVREQTALYESQILKSEQGQRELQLTLLPDENEVTAFVKEASEVINGLDFQAKKSLVANVVERVVGTRDRLKVYGFIPVTTKSNVNVFTSDRHRRHTPRHGFDANSPKLIPFCLEVSLTPPIVSHAWN